MPPLDQYDSFYQVLSGSQTFTLLSPIEGFLLDRKRENTDLLILSAMTQD